MVLVPTISAIPEAMTFNQASLLPLAFLINVLVCLVHLWSGA